MLCPALSCLSVKQKEILAVLRVTALVLERLPAVFHDGGLTLTLHKVLQLLSDAKIHSG